MKTITRICFIFIFALAASQLFADSGLDKIKSLVGEWETTTPEGTTTVKYELISNGTAVEERLGIHEGQMVSIYHMNGDKLMMTHYCAFNNQPRFEGTLDGDTITFRYVDATNLPNKSTPHITGLVLNFKDTDHFTQQWSTNAPGEHGMTMNFQRKK
jgi:hypothetical protein